MFGKKRESQTLLAIGDIMVSVDLTTEMFACDIPRCKGACCVQGDVGAPLEQAETQILAEIYPQVEPYLPDSGRRAILDQGTHTVESDGGLATPLVEGRECAYTVFNDQGIAQCGIEQAFNEGKIDFRKPVSCHLYPIRVHKTQHLEALNYDRWDICNPACIKGEIKGLKVYQFLKEALIRKYGQAFYDELDAIATQREEASS